MRFQSPPTLPNLAIASGATTPVPAQGTGSLAWSTTINAVVSWNGTAWFPDLTAAGSTGQIQFNNAGALGGSTGLTWDNTNKVMVITGATVTTSQPVLNLSQIWNNAATTFTLAKSNVTVTAAAAGSLLYDWQVGGVSKISFSASDFGSCNFGNRDLVVDSLTSGTWFLFNSVGPSMASGISLSWTSGNANGTKDVSLFRDAAGILAQRNGTNAQAFRVYGTYTDASNYRRFGINTTLTGITTLAPEGLGTGATGNALRLPKAFVPQATPVVSNITATLTIANLLVGIVQTTSSTAVSLTLPTGTLSDAGCSGGNLTANDSFTWSLMNLGSNGGTVTIVAGVGHTFQGNAVIALNTSASFCTVKTALNTFITYMIA